MQIKVPRLRRFIRAAVIHPVNHYLRRTKEMCESERIELEVGRKETETRKSGMPYRTALSMRDTVR